MRGLWSISPSVSISKLFAILIAAAMLFAPFATQSGMAMAEMPADHHTQIMGEGHCEGMPATGDSRSADMPCCAAMCAAVAVATASPAEPAVFARTIERAALQQFRHSFLAKLPTPPPRLA